LPSEFEGTISGPGGDQFSSLEEFMTAKRCFVHEMYMPGQGVYISGSGVYISGSGVYISGSTRGLVLGNTVTINYTKPPLDSVTVASVEPGLLVTPSSVSAGVENYQYYVSAEPETGSTVGILVVDDFAGIGTDDLSELLDTLPGHIPDGLEALEAMFVNGELSHGLFVLAHLKALIQATENYIFEDPGSTGREWFQWVHKGVEDARLVVVPVDISQRNPGDPIIPIDTSQIVTSIRLAISLYSDVLHLGDGELSLVVNMSWVLLPCPTVVDFLEAGTQFDSFEAYVMGLEIDADGVQTPNHSDLAWRVSLLRWVPETDPLRVYFDGTGTSAAFAQVSGVDVTLVAAAGNFNMRYQMLPAALPTVLGVGTPVEGQPPPEFSNAADVAARGAWFHLGGVVSYAGTSYSAPLFSLFAAVDLAANKTCMPTGTNPSRPGFGLVKPLTGYVGSRTPLNVVAAPCFSP